MSRPSVVQTVSCPGTVSCPDRQLSDTATNSRGSHFKKPLKPLFLEILEMQILLLELSYRSFSCTFVVFWAVMLLVSRAGKGIRLAQLTNGTLKHLNIDPE